MGKTSRNAPCPCGSGKKYKKCCLDKDKVRERESKAGKAGAAGVQQEGAVRSRPAREIQGLISEAANFAMNNKPVEMCLAMSEAWERLKKEKPPEINSLKALDRHFCDDFQIYNMLQEYEMELGNAGADDPSFYEKRLGYCQEFLNLLPNSEPLVLENMGRAKGETLFALGRLEEGDKVFEQLVQEFPKSPWPYISWGDMYCGYRNSVTDYKKAESIYREALTKDINEEKVVLSRLETLEKKAAKGDREG